MKQESYWPVYGGLSFNFWTPDTGNYNFWADSEKIIQHLQEKRLRQSKIASSAFYGTDPEWLADPSTLPCLHPRVAFRDIASPDRPRSIIACLIPPRVFLIHSSPYLLMNPPSPDYEAFMLGVLCSSSFDWYARRVVELHMTFAVFNSCPVPRPPEDDPLRNRVIHIAGRLAAVDDRYGEWAEQVGVEVASVKTEREKANLIAELDAAVALLYGLDESDIQVIYDTFHRTTGHLPDINAVLGHHRNLQ